MRRILFTFAALAMLMASCTQDNWEVEQNAVANHARTLTVKATMPQSAPNTRVSLEADGTTPHGIVMKWEENDVLKLCFEYNDELFYKDATIVPSSITGDGLTAVFTIDYPVEIGDNNFNVYGVYQKKGEDYFPEGYEHLNDAHARFEEGTKNYILNVVEEMGTTLDENSYGDNQLMTHPMLYFSQENISTITSIDLQHSGWMIALHFKNTSTDPIFPSFFNLFYEAHETNKVWNGLHSDFEVKFNVGDKTFSSNHLETYDWWWGDAEDPYSYLQFNNFMYGYSFGEVDPNEEIVFYRWLVSENLDFNGFTGQMVYNDASYNRIVEQAYADLPGKAVQEGNVYHMYTEWDGREFKFVSPTPYVKEDFIGDFVMLGFTPFSDGEDAFMMGVEIVDGVNENELLIKGVDLAEEIVATFDPSTESIFIEPQPLADFGIYDITLLTLTLDGNSLIPSETALIELQRDLAGNLFVAKFSEAIGYLLYSGEAGGYVDGYYYMNFIRVASGQQTSVNRETSKTLKAHSALISTPKVDNAKAKDLKVKEDSNSRNRRMKNR